VLGRVKVQSSQSSPCSRAQAPSFPPALLAWRAARGSGLLRASLDPPFAPRPPDGVGTWRNRGRLNRAARPGTLKQHSGARTSRAFFARPYASVGRGAHFALRRKRGRHEKTGWKVLPSCPSVAPVLAASRSSARNPRHAHTATNSKANSDLHGGRCSAWLRVAPRFP